MVPKGLPTQKKKKKEEEEKPTMAFSHGFNLYSLAWIVSGVLVVLVPLVYRNMRVNDFRQLNMMYNWDKEWQEYVQQQQQNNMYDYNNAGYWNGENQANANDYYYQRYDQMRASYDANNCKWWQLNCYPYYYNEDGEPETELGWYPSWYSGWAQTEEEREAMMEDGTVSPAMRFVYVWQVLIFAVILAYGMLVFKQSRPVLGLAIALGVFANFCFLAMWWLADGSIVTDAEYVQRTGFYGQFAVLMFMTNAAYVLFGLVHTALLLVWSHNAEEDEKSAGQRKDQQQQQQSGGNKAISPSEHGWTVVE